MTNPLVLARNLYDKLEDDNMASFCAIINWLFNLYEGKYEAEFRGMKAVLESRIYTVKGELLDMKTGEREIKRYKMIVSFEEVK